MRLEYGRVSDMFGGEPEESHERPGEEFARGHYEQLVSATGHVELGEQRWEINGLRLARSLVGPALLAGAVVLPLAHRELR